MPFNRKQIIILFSLITAILVLVAGVVFNFVSDSSGDNSNTSEQALTETITEGFKETARDTGTLTDFEALEDLDLSDKEALAVDKSEIYEPDADLITQDNYISVGNGLELYSGDIEDIAVFVPNSNGLFENSFVRNMDDGSRLFVFDGDLSLAPEIGLIPTLRDTTIDFPSSLMYVEKDEVFIFLGNDITQIIDFTFNDQVYWISFIETETGFDQAYISLPYFENIEKLTGISVDSNNVIKDEDRLIIERIEETGDSNEPLKLVEEVIDVRGIISSPIRRDYSEFVFAKE